MPSTLAHPLGVHERILSKHFLCHDTDEISHTFLSYMRVNFHREVSLSSFVRLTTLNITNTMTAHRPTTVSAT